jgi:hypothetical protein
MMVARRRNCQQLFFLTGIPTTETPPQPSLVPFTSLTQDSTERLFLIYCDRRKILGPFIFYFFTKLYLWVSRTSLEHFCQAL